MKMAKDEMARIAMAIACLVYIRLCQQPHRPAVLQGSYT
jgi:hypothetical protein